MFLSKMHEQTIIEISQVDFIGVVADSFLIDRRHESFPDPKSISIESSCDAAFSRFEKNIIQAAFLVYTERSVLSFNSW